MNPVSTTIILAQSATTFLARVTDSEGNALEQAAVSSVSIEVFDRNTNLQIGETLNPAVDDVIEELQTNPIWTADAVGYNFSVTVAGAFFPAGGTTYRVEATITPVGGDSFIVAWDLPCVEALS